MIRKIITLFILSLPINAFAGLLLQHSLGYNSGSDNISNLAATKLNNYFFIGASLNNDQTIFLGQSVHLWSKNLTSDNLANEDSVSLMELGPRVLWYFGGLKVNYLSFSYNPYAKGTRSIDGEEQSISGSSMIVTYGYQVKLSKVFHLGASIHYQMVSINQVTVGTTETEVTQSYTLITPMLEMNFRF